jgi:hypothetical protein
MDPNLNLPSSSSAASARWMAILLVGELPPPERPAPKPVPPPAPTPAPASGPVPYREGTCPECHRLVRLWLDRLPAATDRHDPGCRYQGEGERLRAAWGA